MELRPGIVNAELINSLYGLCKEYFENPMIQPYAGANRECMFCGATETRTGIDHSVSDCPTLKLKEIINNNSQYFNQQSSE